MKALWSLWQGFTGGFVFGTFGILALALLAMMVPFIEMVTMPCFWPGRMLAAELVGTVPRISFGMVIFLYICTGCFYGFLGVVCQLFFRLLRRLLPKKAPIEIGA